MSYFFVTLPYKWLCPPPPPSSSYLSSGSLMEISATQLGAEAIKNTLNKVKLPPSAVEDVMMGLVLFLSFKVHIFWEGHQIFQNRLLTFWNPTSPSRSVAGQCKKFCLKGWIDLISLQLYWGSSLDFLKKYRPLFTINSLPKLVILRVKILVHILICPANLKSQSSSSPQKMNQNDYIDELHL